MADSSYRNVIIGFEAGYKSNDVDNNVYIGSEAGYRNEEGSGNVFLGHKSGYDNYESNKLIIHTSASKSPLIYFSSSPVFLKYL